MMMDMKRRDLLKIMGTAGVLVPSTGCATLLNLLKQVMNEPTVEITKMSLKDVSLSSITTEFSALITNPNPFGFDLEGLDYALSIQGARFASGKTPGGVKLKPEGKATTKFEVGFDLGKTASAILDLIGKKVVDYTVDTTFHFQVPKIDQRVKVPQQSFAIPASYSGSLPMPAIPAFTVKNFDVQSISLSGVKFRVTSNVMNPNSFSIPIDAFEFDVKLGGRNVLSNKTVDGLNLAAKKASNVGFDFNVSLVDIGITAVELAQRPNLKWEVASKIASGKLDLPFTNKGTVKLA
jgi:LEA14-like dessication related protein